MLRTLTSFLSALLVVTLAAFAFAEDTEAPKKTSKDDLAKEAIAEVKEKRDEYNEAQVVQAVRKLAAFYKDEEVTDSVKKPIPAMIDGFANSKDDGIKKRGLAGLADLGPGEGGKRLLSHLGKVLKKKELDEGMLLVVMRGFESMADESSKVVKQLVKLLKNKENAVVGYAAKALGGYHKSDGKLRKELFEEIVKQSEGVYQQGKVGQDKNQKRKWNIIGSKVMQAINRLSKQSFPDPLEARQWFNDNKKNKKAWQ